MRFLAVTLPGLTLCTHIMLGLFFILQIAPPDRAHFSLSYNILAAGASIAGLVGAIRCIPSLVSAYTLIHTITLSFVTLALVDIIAPLPFFLLNPVLPSWDVDDSAICRDIDAGFGWDDEWLSECSKGFKIIKILAVSVTLLLMGAQWWALFTVKKWNSEIRLQQPSPRLDVEKGGILHNEKDVIYGEKN
ncbi:hypothetical protein IQ07DRAFT_589042 [Pyrenochaeta sp. DS3sAY3a]|nr:hypothetical protein IQ07DRAFT_589042 [Pyrenochaeta sp. DS3sAY3a]